MFIRLKYIVRLWAHRIRLRARRREKIFVIGTNKTGTTSLHGYFQACGFLVSPQWDFEQLADEFHKGNHARVFELIDLYETFQDTPFSLANVDFLNELTERYPQAKFILSVRESSDVWYQSLMRFHSKAFFDGRTDVTWDDVKRVNYVAPGRMYQSIKRIVGDESTSPYDESTWKSFYEGHNQKMRTYFAQSPNFLEVDLSDPSAQRRLSAFLGTDPAIPIPHLNTSR